MTLVSIIAVVACDVEVGVVLVMVDVAGLDVVGMVVAVVCVELV